ncbi:hypothetical protein BS50DRAFT_492995 [Corynespora cassiicola Philippines]|uniref:Rhodopsin domain-containing protein n=1 Tax=Corynespora cassiicola Philippines TaxID=1448308 RepID=A0A2T2NQC0_CORCC|nr:hypothetical protein BS50DRAFT_492995 [Corynespora cassiicola Philippines]
MTPEYIAYTNAPALRAQTVPIYVIATILVLVRSYVRLFMLKTFGKDDWTMLFALLFATATFSCYMAELNLGLGRHPDVVIMDKARYEQLIKVRVIHMMFIVTGLGLVKISVSLFLLRLATRKLYRLFLYGLVAFMVLFTLACDGTLGKIFQCIPLKAAWKMDLRPPPFGTGNAKCYTLEVFQGIALFNHRNFYSYPIVVNIVTDFLVALLPVPLIWQLQLRVRARVSLIVILSLGLFAAVAGIVRALKLMDIDDWTNDSYGIWNFMELFVGIIAASLPGLKPLFSRFFHAARAFTSGSAKTTAFKDVNSLGYHRQNDRSDKGLVLQDLRDEGSSSARVSTQTGHVEQTGIWTIGRAKNSDESVLPLHDLDGKGILVTRDVHISR